MLRSIISISKKKIAFTILVILLLQIDNPLNKESKTLLDKAEHSQSSAAYIYLLGIFASPQDDPIKVGRQQYEEFKKSELDKTYQIQEYSDISKLPLPDAKLNCRTWEDNCLPSLFDNDVDIKLLIATNQTLINRVKQLYGYQDYKTLTAPTIFERLPDYQYLSWANRLNSYNAINKFKVGEIDSAVNLLLQNISTLRAQLEKQDNLIGKIIYITLISEEIDVLSVILSKSKNGVVFPSLPNLTLSEKNIELSISREFAMNYNVLKSLDRDNNFFRSEANDKNLPAWFIRIVFKPNMSINSRVPDYLKMIDLSILKPDEFAAALQKKDQGDNQTDKSSHSYLDLIKNIRNIQGSILNRVSRPDYNYILTRILDLDVKIKIFNQFHLKNQNVEMIQNPYFKSQTAFIDGNRVCVNGPIEEKEYENRYIRCIQIDI